MHVRIKRPIPPRQLVSCDDASRNGLSPDEYLPHDQILMPCTDNSAKRFSSRPLPDVLLPEYSFGATGH
jgi:hypothetical protein